jgi:hypothetical protein
VKARRRTRYETAFALTATVLASGALFAFTRLDVVSRARTPAHPWRSSSVAAVPGSDAGVLTGARAIAPTDSDYRRFAAEDAEWRRVYAQLPDLHRMKRQAMQERIHLLTRAGGTGAAIRELNQWTGEYPNDREALLWLARLLRESGRTNEALAKYRLLLTLSERSR